MGASFGGGNSSSGSRFSRRAMSEINVTPMVDVMLVLLIIFMVTAPMLTAGVSVDLPQTKADPLPGTDEPLVISVKSDGSIYLQETRIDMEKLPEKLSAVTGEKKDSRIFVRGDKRISYGKMMEVVGTINSAGFTKVALVTEVVEQQGAGKK